VNSAVPMEPNTWGVVVRGGTFCINLEASVAAKETAW
jgi:hypothetical protein